MSGSDPFAAFEAGLQTVSGENILSPEHIKAEMRQRWNEFYTGMVRFHTMSQAKSPNLSVYFFEQEAFSDGPKVRCTIAAEKGADQPFVTDVHFTRTAMFFHGGPAEFQADCTKYYDGIPVNEQGAALALIGPHILHAFA